jgi:hypothetical protein
LISGHDLIDILGMRPGPELGQLLEALREAQAEGEVVTREEALRFVQRRSTGTDQHSSSGINSE